MYLLRAGLKLSDSLDTPDLRYLHSSHGIIVNPLQPNLDIKMFNEEWFDGRLSTDEPQYVPIPVSMQLEGPRPQWNDKDHDDALPQAPVEQIPPQRKTQTMQKTCMSKFKPVGTSYFSSNTPPNKYFARIGMWCVYLPSSATQHQVGFAPRTPLIFTPSTPMTLPL
jgi:hypothetical protein